MNDPQRYSTLSTKVETNLKGAHDAYVTHALRVHEENGGHQAFREKSTHEDSFAPDGTHRKYGGPWWAKARPPPATTRLETTPKVSPHITNVVSLRGYSTRNELAAGSSIGGRPGMGGGGRKKQGKKIVSALKSHIKAFRKRSAWTDGVTSHKKVR